MSDWASEWESDPSNNSSSKSTGGNGGYGDSGGGSSGGYSGGGNKGGFGGGDFPKYKLPEPTIPYFPYAISSDQDAIPQEALDKLSAITHKLEAEGFTLRVSPSSSIFSQAENGIRNKEIVLPFFNFNDHKENYWPNKKIKAITEAITPGLDRVPKKAQSFVHVKTSLMLGVYGSSPVRFLITYTPDGITDHTAGKFKDTGREIATIRIANIFNIPVFNMKDADSMEGLKRYVGSFAKINNQGNYND